MKAKLIQIFMIMEYLEDVLIAFFLSVILIDFVFKIGKNFYPKVFLDECIYTAKEKKVRKY